MFVDRKGKRSFLIGVLNRENPFSLGNWTVSFGPLNTKLSGLVSGLVGVAIDQELGYWR